MIASCFDFSGKRNKVVYSDMNFPSVMYFWEAQRSRGARVHMVRTDDGVHVPTERMVDAIDEETLLVPISHVVFRSAYIKDVKAIVEKAHRVGALVVLDCFQSLGAVPVDVQAFNVDFAVGGVLKWLCGGAGTSYLIRAPRSGEEAGSRILPAGSPMRSLLRLKSAQISMASLRSVLCRALPTCRGSIPRCRG